MTIAGCSETPITPGVVQFNAAEFLALYPVFTPQAAALAGNFALASLQLNNTCGSRIQDAPTRQTLLYLLTCHITALLNGVGSTPATGAVGRLSDATEGSVSASLEYLANGGPSQAYYIQTQWGAQYWQCTAPFRQARYVAPCYGSAGWPGPSPYGYGGCGCP